MKFNQFKIFPVKLNLLLLATGILFEFGLLYLINLGNLTIQAGQYVGIFLVLLTIFFIASALILNHESSQKENIKGLKQINWIAESGKLSLITILFFAVLFRVTALFAAPTLSTDQFRYTWEGSLVARGISPYQYPPSDPKLINYRNEIWPLVQQKETTSPYPPFSQLTGFIEYKLFGESLLGPKIAAVFFDMLVCLTLVWVLGLYGLDPKRVLLYAWCPLPVIEFGQSGHNDSQMLFFLVLAVGLTRLHRPGWSAITLGLACLAKITPLFALPLFITLWLSKGVYSKSTTGIIWKGLAMPRFWYYPVLTIATIVAGYFPFLLAGSGAIGSILEYTGSWRDNDSLIFQLTADFTTLAIAKGLSIIILLSVITALSFSPFLLRELTLPRRLSLLFGITLLLASTVHSWYVSWVLVFIPLIFGKDRMEFTYWDKGWLLFAGLVQLPYLAYNKDLSILEWVKPLEYWPLYICASISLFWFLRNRKRAVLAQKANV